MSKFHIFNKIFNNIAIQNITPRWQVDKELSRVQQVFIYV